MICVPKISAEQIPVALIFLRVAPRLRCDIIICFYREATLPPLNQAGNLAKRRAMMDAQERKEWAFREKEIEE